MTTPEYKFKPPFEIYNNGCDIADQDGHVCTSDDPMIAQALLHALQHYILDEAERKHKP